MTGKRQYPDLDSDIINALRELARRGYPVVAAWQIQMWLSPPHMHVPRRTLSRYLKRLHDKGAVKRFYDIAPTWKRGYMLPRYPSLSEVISGKSQLPIPISRQVIARSKQYYID